MKILLERTDETHSITMPEIIDALAAYDISAECKTGQKSGAVDALDGSRCIAH